MSGVPQGSVLGPLLFLIFVADLPKLASFGSKLYQFADDLKLMRQIRDRNDEISMQNDIWKITEWSSQWLLDLNFQKCKVSDTEGEKILVIFSTKIRLSRSSLSTRNAT